MMCLTCISPGSYFYILGELGVFKSYETCELSLFGAIYNGRLWEKELCVSAQYKALFTRQPFSMKNLLYTLLQRILCFWSFLSVLAKLV